LRHGNEIISLDKLFCVGEQSAMDSFAGFEVFARVVEAGSFTAAASGLGMAKSSVSETVRALEDRLGVRLLDRTTRRVRPTGAGQVFYARCRRVLEEAQAARIEAQTHQATPTGQLRIAAPEGFARRYVVPGLPAFLAAHPALEIELVEGAGLVRLVEEQFDLAIRVTRSLDEGLVVRQLATSRPIIAAAPGYLAAHGMPMCPEDVTRHRCVAYSPLSWAHTWRFTGRAEGAPSEQVVAVRPILLLNSIESLVAAARAGIGLTVLPDWAVTEALAEGSLTRVLRDFETPASGIYAVYPTNRLITPAVRLFVNHLTRELRLRGLPA
jgi:DNA-binding transcriptional LysR family regulator